MQEINITPTPPAAPGLNIGAIYDCLFRHKWKIIVFTLAGIIAAAYVYFFRPPAYISEAKLFLRYVVESKPNSQTGLSDSQMRSLDSRGGNIINSEIEILTSMDLATNVVSKIGAGDDAKGARTILKKVDGGTNFMRAAGYVRAHVKAEVANGSNVIRVTFEHPDPDLPQLVLRFLIESYREKHFEIHHDSGISDELGKRMDQIKERLTVTEERLRNLRQTNEVTSIEDSRKGYQEQVLKIQEEVYNCEAEWEESKAALKELSRLAGGKPVASDPAKAEVAKAEPPPEKVEEYNRLYVTLNELWKNDARLRNVYTSENAQVKQVQADIGAAEKRKKELEQEYPALVQVSVGSPTALPRALVQPADLFNAKAKVNGLEAKFRALTNRLESVRTQAGTLDGLESVFTGLQRQRDFLDTQVRNYSAASEQATLDSLAAAKTANITQVEAPAPPFPDTKNLMKLVAGLLAGGFGVGLALALLCDKVIDQTLRRPAEVESRLRLPFLLTVPDISRNGYRQHGRVKRGFQLPAPSSADPKLGNGSNGKLEIAPWDPHHTLHTYYESLRDRLISYFEVRNMTHKPKLVAITGCNRGCGATTLATGLAASLSETGEGNVLLVDMNTEEGSLHPFYDGRPQCDLAEVLENEKRANAMVQDNLYVVTEGTPNGGLPRVLPKRFMHLIPKLKASDYDYIIFDMPSMNQTSVTPRLASFMDMVLLVIESEKTDGDLAKRACDLLMESKANVSIVLNKRRSYVPTWLHREW